MKRLVLLGGGHAHIEVLRELAPCPRRARTSPWSRPTRGSPTPGMLPGHIAGHYALEECTIDLAALARAADAELALTTASLVSPDASEVVCANGSVLAYDVLSLDVGSRSFHRRGARRRVARDRRASAGAARERLERRLRARGEGPRALGDRGRRRRRRHRARAGDEPSLATDPGGAGAARARGLRCRGQRAFRRRAPPASRGACAAPASGSHVGSAGGRGRPRFRAPAKRPRVRHRRGVLGDRRRGARLDPRLGPRHRRARLPAHQRPAAVDLARQHVRRGRLRHRVEATEMPKAGVFAVRAAPMLAANLRAALAGTAAHAFTARRATTSRSSPPASVTPWASGAGCRGRDAGRGAGRTASTAASSRGTAPRKAA